MSLFSAIAFVVVVFTMVFQTSTAAINSCSSNPQSSKASHFHCPPFTSLPSFPFSASPGCGHPSFQIRCSDPLSTISINDLSFNVVHYNPNSSSLTLSPNVTSSGSLEAAGAGANCSHSSLIPWREVNLTRSPFRVADVSCSRLSSLRPCSAPLLRNCSHCPWECRLAKSPVYLLRRYCSADRRRVSDEGCQNDVLGYLEEMLGMGIEFEWDEAQDSYFMSCRHCRSKHGVCGFDPSDPDKRFVCFQSRSRFSPPWIGGDDPKRFAILCSAFALACLLLFSLIVAAIYRSKRSNWSSDSAAEDSTAQFLHRHRSASSFPLEFAYEELEASTDGFDPKRKIGDGGFGSVYLGQLIDGRFVAVKYLHRHSHTQGRTFSSKSFCNEILILSSIDHPNLVKLHGYCSDPRGLLLVYDYVPNGTLAHHLHGLKPSYGREPLSWRVRVEIALQTAMAMEYLHFAVVPRIVHRDITSSNIFVEKDMRIKVGDFGLSRLLVLAENSSNPNPNSNPQTGCVWTGPQGTPGYLDPDYHRSFLLTEKSDVYSFGVVLLELITGLRAVDQSRDRRDISLADLVVSKIHMGLLHQVVDPALMDGSDTADGVEAAAELAFRCVAADKDDRPDAREIVEELKLIRTRTCGSGIDADVAKC